LNQVGGLFLSEPVSIASGIASRYATAIFELARADKKIKDLESDVNDLDMALKLSADLRSLVTSPLYTRDQVENAISSISRLMKLQPNMVNALALMAKKRRLFVLPNLLIALRERVAQEKGQAVAEAFSARALSKSQIEKLSQAIKSKLGMDVEIKVTVDKTIIGGLVVKVGSKMIDTSIISKLNALQNKMKEVG
tara:strand:- start:5427 stop:6011 length:585 start_codon:yes stop_codon:yes gene_type:complete